MLLSTGSNCCATCIWWTTVKYCVLQFDQGGLVLQKEQYSNKTDKDHKVCIVAFPSML